MARRPRIEDVAQAAGVSIATVDRVLNARAPVRAETAQRVSDAAEAIGYHGAAAIRSRLAPVGPTVALGLVLQKPRHAFYQDFARHVAEAAAVDSSRQWRLTTSFAPGPAPSDFAGAIRAMAGRVQAVAATGIDHHEVTAAVDHLRAAGVPVFSLLSDFAQGVRDTYLGTNNLKTGRTAGWLMRRIARPQGRIAVFIGGHRFHGHDLRETGCRSYFREYAPEVGFLDTLINLETRQLTHESTLALLDRHADLAGIYCAGGGMEGAISALRESGRAGEVALIVHELTPESREGLLDGTVAAVLATPLATLAGEILGAVSHVLDHGMAVHPGQRFLSPVIVTPESL